jgi:hypothetical protein
MSVFSEETLFYIFYAMPQDVLQDAAAQELYNRHWRYHKEHGVWLTKDATALDSIQRTATHERGRFIIFDHHQWQRVTKETVIAYDALEERGVTSQHSANMLHGNHNTNITTTTTNTSSGNLLGHNPLMHTPHGSLVGLFGGVIGSNNHSNLPLTMPSTPSTMNNVTTNSTTTATSTSTPTAAVTLSATTTTNTTASATASVSTIATTPAALVATAPMANEVVNNN